MANYAKYKFHFTLIFLLIALNLLATGAAIAQTWPQSEGVVVDATGRLDSGEINSAAGDLRAIGVKPFVVFLNDLNGYPNEDALARAAIAEYGLGQGETPDPNLFLVMVALGPRRNTIFYGDNLVPALDRTEGGRRVIDSIRLETLNTRLAAGDYTDAIAQTFREAARRINLERNPSATAAPQPPISIDTGGIGEALIWIALGIAVLVGLAVGIPFLVGTMRRRNENAARRRSLQDQFAQARNVTADMITQLDFPADPREQIQYRFLALALENERPEELADYEKRYAEMRGRVAKALDRYDDIVPGKLTTEEDLKRAIGEYQFIQTEVKAAQDFLFELAERGRTLDAEIATAPGEIESAKKVLAAASESIAKLAAASTDPPAINSERAIEPAQRLITEADTALSGTPTRPFRAIKRAAEARAAAETVADHASALAAAYHELTKERARLAAARNGGYKLPESEEAFTIAQQSLAEAVRLLESGGDGFESALSSAQSAVHDAGAAVGGVVALHKENVSALNALHTAGEETKAYIAAGATAFDKVDEYAESSWQDIRGNGTEAQHAADEAFRLWQEASALNSVTPDSPQDFQGARTLIDEANSQLALAQQLIKAILDRLARLEESSRIAQGEISAAEHDIKAGREFVAQHNPDITPNPEVLIKEAAERIALAKREIAQRKPDWIRVVRLAREANDRADRALADARNQQQAMQAHRNRVNTLTQQAEASLSRAANFSNLHLDTISRDLFGAVQQAEQLYKEGLTLATRAERDAIQDIQRARGLEEAGNVLEQAMTVADTEYNEAYTQFQALETARQEAYAALQRADSTVREAASYIDENAHALGSGPKELLEKSIELLPNWVRNGNEASYRALSQRAREAESAAEEAYNQAAAEVSEYRERESAQRMADIVGTILAVGAQAAMSAGRRGRRGGGGGGIFGGGGSIGGGGGWGSGGSSGGGWGGGGSSGGSWGGGGSGGGGWGGGGSSGGGW